MTATRKLRVGIAGMTSDHVWGMGDGLAALPEVELVAGAEPYAELRERATQQWALQRTYEDFDKMLDAEELDVILVCTDNAAKADAAEDAGITLMVAYHSAFNPTYDQVKELLQTGAVGNVYLARGVTGHGGPVEFGCSQYFCEWLFDRQRNGGGTFVDEACYLLDGFVDYLGAIKEVSAFAAHIAGAGGQ